MSEDVEKVEVIVTNPEDWFRYEKETLDPILDDGTMPENIEILSQAVIGHKIVKAEKGIIDRPEYVYRGNESAFILTLDDGSQVTMVERGDCCAYTSLETFLLNPENVEHVITGVGTTEGYTKWHIYADFGDILELEVDWSAGNTGYYGYGFDIAVVPISEQPAIDMPEYKVVNKDSDA